MGFEEKIGIAFSLYLKQFRKRLKLKQTDFSEKIGVNFSTYRKYEQNSPLHSINFSIEIFLKIAEVYEIEPLAMFASIQKLMDLGSSRFKEEESPKVLNYQKLFYSFDLENMEKLTEFIGLNEEPFGSVLNFALRIATIFLQIDQEDRIKISMQILEKYRKISPEDASVRKELKKFFSYLVEQGV
jgi:transcriptional regulator with XRE-family HTH domain